MFKFARQQIWATFVDQMGAFFFFIRLVYAKVVASMKRQCEKVVGQIITKLQG
jgi:hypothetical protein